MAFKLMKKRPYPIRQWALAGFAEDGKSTFSTQMAAPILPIDADHRYDQVMHLAVGDVYQFSSIAADHVIIDRITQRLYEEMTIEPVGTIVVDSVTELIAPFQALGVWDNLNEVNQNKMTSFIPKAMAMRLLQSAVTRWGTDVLWIYHLQKGKDNNAEDVETRTISKVELARLTRSLNAKLRIVRDGRKRGIYAEWSRGRDQFTLWDNSDHWVGMPEKLDEAMYDGLGTADLARKQIPSRFAGPDEAIEWAVQQKRFATAADARKAYDEVKKTHKPEKASQMWDLWVAHVTTAPVTAELPEMETEEEAF